MSRRDELAAALAAVHERVERACADAGRSPDDVTVVAVTKTFPASDVVELAALGVRDVGENRDQEAAAKVEEVAELGGEGTDRLRWHFVGQLQRNKAAAVARYADVVHSVDRERLVTALDHGAERAGRTLDVLLQVDLEPGGGADARGGARPGDVAAVAEAVAAASALRLRGVMAVAPRGADPREAFERLAQVAERLRADHPDATWVSAGMSGDLEAAVACGATHLRVGSAVLGSRPSLR
ncbi:YggS family pyridoxal phosphate-dependent enzyme [Angustibacter peucedani]